ncbi:MAG: CRTAC1 family protein [Marinicella sp.]
MTNKTNQILVLIALICNMNVHAQLFEEATVGSGIDLIHSNLAVRQSESTVIGAGGAVGDYDYDGFPDFYLIGGSGEYNALYHNTGNGHFIDVAESAQVNLYDILGSGPVFVDVDGDFDLDLVVFSINKQGQAPHTGDSIENRPRLFINLGNGGFMESANSGFYSGMSSFMGTFGDFDNDGDQDLFMTHWIADETTSKQLFWENDGFGFFTDVTIEYLGLTQNANFDRWTFTPNITDINEDGWLDVLLTSDFGTTRILYNNGFVDGQPPFLVTQAPFITDENGMGAAVADYDNDGDLDWFVTSIWDPDGKAEANWGVSGNRLYRNTGLGVFEDATDEAGIRQGYWGWGACFADFNNDGHLDIYHENGFTTPVAAEEFHFDPAILFMANGDGTFTESAAANGLNHTQQGRGISCVDYDLDGDIDILVMPNNSAYRLYENLSDSSKHYLDIKLFDSGPNPYAINAKIQVQTPASTQLRELTGGSNYVSNNSLTQHFGLNEQTTVNSVNVTWPDGEAQTINTGIDIDQITSIGRYCHTKYLTQINQIKNPTADLVVYLHDLSGAPISAREVTLQVTNGPNLGESIMQVTDINGISTYHINAALPGTDRIQFKFNVDSEEHVCHALVRWNIDLIFKDDFE